MRVVLFGATGMVGAGVLHECLADPRVTSVLAVGRSPCGVAHPKLEERLHHDFFDYAPVQSRFAGRDACFFCLGVSSAGMDEPKYRRLTHDLTLAAARALSTASPAMTFCYVSGAGTNERGRMMWARVKGETENALLHLPFPAAYMLRPGFIQPLRGYRSKTAAYRLFYAVFAPLYPLLRRVVPGLVTTTEVLGRAMIRLAAEGYPRNILETADINAVGAAG